MRKDNESSSVFDHTADLSPHENFDSPQKRREKFITVIKQTDRLVPKSACCGLVSLRIALITTNLLDITVGIAAGFFIYLGFKTKSFVVTLSLKAFIEFFKAVVALVCLTLILMHKETQNQGHKLQLFRFYFVLSFLSGLLLPMIDLSTLV